MVRSWHHWLASIAVVLGVSFANASQVRADDQPAAEEMQAEEKSAEDSSADDSSPEKAESKGVSEKDQPRQRGAGLFKQLDQNSDGQIAADEISPEHERLHKRLLRNADANDDGQLSAAEFESGLRQGPPRNDKPAGNTDEPRRKGKKEPRPEGKPAEQMNKPKEGAGKPTAGRERRRPEPGKFFARLDSNGDGKVEQDEIPEPLRERFEKGFGKADVDGDGAISKEEFAQHARKLADGRPQPDRGPRNDGTSKKGDEGRGPAGRSAQRGDRPDFQRPGDGARPAGPAPMGPPPFGGPRFGDNRGPGTGRPGGPGPGGPFGGGPIAIVRVLDKNGDGTISGEELAEASESLKKLDRDGDGALSRREVLPGPGRMTGLGDAGAKRPDGGKSDRPREDKPQLDQPRPDKLQSDKPGREFKRPDVSRFMKHLDQNEDGKLSRDELPEPMRDRIEKFDRSGDGAITVEEFAAATQAFGRPHGGPKGGPDRPRHGSADRERGERSPEAAAQHHEQRFKQLDKDQDGAISAGEWRQQPGRPDRDRKTTRPDRPSEQ